MGRLQALLEKRAERSGSSDHQTYRLVARERPHHIVAELRAAGLPLDGRK